MTRIYGHAIADAPEASRPMLEGIVPFSPTAYFLSYAQTPMDLPADPAPGAGASAGLGPAAGARG